MTSFKEITELAGYTSRVHEMFQVFEDAKRGVYQRALVGGDSFGGNRGERFDTSKISGKVVDSPDYHIVLEDVPIVTPNGDVIVREMNLAVSRVT